LLREAKQLTNNNTSEISQRSEISVDTGSVFAEIFDSGTGSERKRRILPESTPALRFHDHHYCFANCESESALDPVPSEFTNLCKISDLLFFARPFFSQSKGLNFVDYFFDVCCVN